MSSDAGTGRDGGAWPPGARASRRTDPSRSGRGRGRARPAAALRWPPVLDASLALLQGITEPALALSQLAAATVPGAAALCVGELFELAAAEPSLVVEPRSAAGLALLPRLCEVAAAACASGHAVIHGPGAGELLPVLGRLDFSSALVVPLRSASRTEGWLALVAAPPDRYCALDRAYADHLGAACGAALAARRALGEARADVGSREQLLAEVSHDLRNPLTSLLLQLGRLTPRAELPAAARALEGIRVAARRMETLCATLLDASRLQVGCGTLPLVPVPLRPLLAETLALLAPVAEAGGVALELAVEEPGPVVLGDRQRLAQLFANVAGNCVKFTPAGGSVKIGAVESGARVRITVRDTGCGIPAAQLPRIFDRYWHAPHGNGGAGLGLFLARRIVDAHGGQLRVESEVGAGTLFTICLRRDSGGTRGDQRPAAPVPQLPR